MAGHSPCTIYLSPIKVLVAQLVEHPPGVQKVMGFQTPLGTRIFSSLFLYVSAISLKIYLVCLGSRCFLFTISNSSCTDAPSSSVVSVKWETGAKKSQKQRKKKSSITKTGPDLKQHNDVVGSPTSPQPKTSPW